MKIEEFPLDHIKYKRGWTFHLDAPNDSCPVYKLMITSLTMNSYDEGQYIGIRHEFMVPPADYVEDVWLAWIFERVQDVEAKHEAGEFFQFAGQRVFAPHHGNGQDPYRVWFMSDHAHTRTKSGHNDIPTLEELRQNGKFDE